MGRAIFAIDLSASRHVEARLGDAYLIGEITRWLTGS